MTDAKLVKVNRLIKVNFLRLID